MGNILWPTAWPSRLSNEAKAKNAGRSPLKMGVSQVYCGVKFRLGDAFTLGSIFLQVGLCCIHLFDFPTTGRVFTSPSVQN